MSGQGKCWVITINNPSEEILADCNSWLKQFVDDGRAVFCVGQLERGREGTLHLQAYFIFKKRERFSTIQAWFPRAHLEQARGSKADNVAYCSKEDSRVEGPWQHGEVEDQQGRRTDLLDACKLLQDKKTLSDVADAYPTVFVKYHNGLRALDTQVNGRGLSRQPVTVNLFYGLSNCGKTSYAVSKMNPERFHRQTAPYTFWDGLETSTETLLIDDYRGEMAFTFFLQVIDQYAMRLQVKGSSVCCKFTTIWITSNLHPFEWYPQEMTQEVNRRALLRRLHHIWWVTSNGRHVPVDFVGNPDFAAAHLPPLPDLPQVN